MSNRPLQKGVTLVELMVGLALGTFLLAGVLHIFVSSNQTHRTNEALSRGQESGRFAMDFLVADIRQAGYKGSCTTEVNNLLNESGVGYSADLFDLDTGIFGWNDASAPHTLTNYANGTDAILVKHAAQNTGVAASGNTAADASNIQLANASNLPTGSIVVVADSLGCDVFQNTIVSPTPPPLLLARDISSVHPGPGNKDPLTNDFSHTYGDDMEILLMRSAIYFVGAGASGFPSLRRVRFDDGVATQEELVEGVIDMQICYGIDTTLNREADEYRHAGAVAASDWNDVVSARITLVTMSPQPNVTTDVQTLSFTDCDGAVLNRDFNDYPELAGRRLAQVFSSTIGLRNRLP